MNSQVSSSRCLSNDRYLPREDEYQKSLHGCRGQVCCVFDWKTYKSLGKWRNKFFNNPEAEFWSALGRFTDALPFEVDAKANEKTDS